MLSYAERIELEKQAQAKLAEARQLLKDAAALARQGQFVLEFNTGGTFIPRDYKNPELYRDEAVEILKREGRNDGWDREAKCTKYTPYDMIPADEMDAAVQSVVDDIISELIPYEFREYGDSEGTDSWWRPSTC